MSQSSCINSVVIQKLNRGIMFFYLLLLAPFTVSAQSFEEGTHYSVIEADSASKIPEVVEYFSFSCPGCYAIEPHISTLLKTRPVNKVRRVHMPFGGRKAKLAQKVFVLMKLLDGSKYKDAIFARIHSARNAFDNEEEIIDYFERLGYERIIVAQTLRSFSADTMVRKMNQLGIKNQIRIVPTIIVNGKYKVNIRAINSEKYLAALVQFLNGLSEQ